MDRILYYVCIPLGELMKWCWQLVGNYGLAIVLFTLATKIVLLPFSVWIHKNSIQMVKIQPAVNFLKVNHYGDMDTFADEQAKLFKKEKYHPMLSLVPLALQIFFYDYLPDERIYYLLCLYRVSIEIFKFECLKIFQQLDRKSVV